MANGVSSKPTVPVVETDQHWWVQGWISGEMLDQMPRSLYDALGIYSNSAVAAEALEADNGNV